MKVNHKWRGKDKTEFQPVIIPHWDVAQARSYQGRGRGMTDLHAMHSSDGDRAAMLNRKLPSPVPKNLKAEHFIKGPAWGTPRPA